MNELYSNRFNPACQDDPTPQESYFYKVTEGDTFQYGELDLAIKQALEIALKSIVDFSFEEQEITSVELHSNGTGFVQIVYSINPLEMALEIAKLAIEMKEIETRQWSKTGEEIDQLRELNKELTKIIDG